jgi:glycosyltransferase involved in cell wall biosynthesis
MKLLQVCNVAQIVGGTGACAWTITKALPDWDHALYFFSSAIDEETARAFVGHALYPNKTPLHEKIEEIAPDVILFHNTAEPRMPPRLPDGIPSLYYQHSAARSCQGARERCDVFFAVSKYLADQVNIADNLVLHQPVPVPPAAPRPRAGVIGRLCTPHTMKWRPNNLSLYGDLNGSSFDWEFIGAPPVAERQLLEALDKPFFGPASWESRKHLHSWKGMLYHADQAESYGRTVCEAQRAGCVPIVDKRGGFVEQIEHGKTGFLCETTADFRDAVAALEDPSTFDEMSKQAKLSGDRRGSLAAWRDKFLQWVRAILEAE